MVKLGSDFAAGVWFVDSGCIDSGMCRVVAPNSFGEGASHAFVSRQPADAAETLRAGMALVACPVSAIHGEGADLRAAALAFPDEVLPGVFACGFANGASYGASSWLIVRDEDNVMIDVPRPVPALLERIRGMGGVQTLVLTHQDDVAGHEKVAAKFGCERVIHRDGARAVPGAQRLIEGHEPIELALA